IISNTSMTGELPFDSWDHSSYLRKLHVDRNKFYGEMPQQFLDNWNEIKDIVLSDNYFNGNAIKRFNMRDMEGNCFSDAPNSWQRPKTDCDAFFASIIKSRGTVNGPTTFGTDGVTVPTSGSLTEAATTAPSSGVADDGSVISGGGSGGGGGLRNTIVVTTTGADGRVVVTTVVGPEQQGVAGTNGGEGFVVRKDLVLLVGAGVLVLVLAGVGFGVVVRLMRRKRSRRMLEGKGKDAGGELEREGTVVSSTAVSSMSDDGDEEEFRRRGSGGGSGVVALSSVGFSMVVDGGGGSGGGEKEREAEMRYEEMMRERARQRFLIDKAGRRTLFDISEPSLSERDGDKESRLFSARIPESLDPSDKSDAKRFSVSDAGTKESDVKLSNAESLPTRKEICGWPSSRAMDWLESMDVSPNSVEVLRRCGVSGRELMEVTEGKLKEMGMVQPVARRIVLYVVGLVGDDADSDAKEEDGGGEDGERVNEDRDRREAQDTDVAVAAGRLRNGGLSLPKY
ncbi:hypothetical protein HDU97_006460, partial [Phlyctochytrium planicorne]